MHEKGAAVSPTGTESARIAAPSRSKPKCSARPHTQQCQFFPKEADHYPETLFQDIGPDSGPWWALHTQPRREKELMRRLLGWELPYYCPIIPKKNRSPSGRVRTSYIPLFAGYVFLQADAESRAQVLTTNLVLRTLPIADVTTLIRELDGVRQLIESNVPLTIESKIEPGQSVRVTSGPFAGVEGVVVKRRSVDRLLVTVSFLQQGASVEIGDFQVEKM